MRRAAGDLEVTLPYVFPKIVTLCGSTRFKAEFEEEMKKLTLKGVIVLTVGMFGHVEGLDMDGSVKKMLDELHLRKIDMSEEVRVVNPKVAICLACGKPAPHVLYPTIDEARSCQSGCCRKDVSLAPYFGESTKKEISYAKSKGVTVTYLNPVEEKSNGL